MAEDATQLRKGILELAILRLVKNEPMYGGQIIASLASYPGLNSPAGTVYPILTRLTKNSYLNPSWRESPVGPPRKYYAITAQGNKALAAQTQAWRTLVVALDSLLKDHHD
ncbi:PadR family transcriptional regulator [Arcanobacterium haemolyticum]|nr:PadR family transcriptional regulator [Arcanobacterium haemolyticum]